jgi:hypothetical protein
MSLDDTLAAWAATVALSDNEAAGIFARIVPDERPVQLGGAWWRDYTSGFTTRMVDSMKPVRFKAA